MVLMVGVLLQGEWCLPLSHSTPPPTIFSYFLSRYHWTFLYTNGLSLQWASQPSTAATMAVNPYFCRKSGLSHFFFYWTQANPCSLYYVMDPPHLQSVDACLHSRKSEISTHLFPDFTHNISAISVSVCFCIDDVSYGSCMMAGGEGWSRNWRESCTSHLCLQETVYISVIFGRFAVWGAVAVHVRSLSSFI